ncbi:DUF4153 domain-containing protein [Nocardia sp. NPDC005978]|uniref:DUF4153 domain-containing protein n=1 Tax=Nocardia sp. NPDC005978 TaxID=3156725 RepID=UPI0033A950A0
MPPGAVGWGAPGLPGAAAPVAPQWLTTLGLNGGNLSAGAEPMRPIAHMPGLPVRPVPKSTRIPMAKGTLPAIAISGLAGAVLIPLDRPGIGWLLAGLATAGAVYAVDTTARRRADAPDASDAPDAPPTDPATRDDRPETGPDTATTGDRPKSGNEHAGPAIEAKPIAGQLFSTSISRDTDAANRSVETTPPNRPIDPATSPQARAEAHIDPPADSGTNDEPDAAGQIAAAPTAPAAPAEPVPASTRASTPPGITPPPPPASSTTATANPADARLDKPAGDTAWTRLFGTPGSQRSVTIGRVWWVALAIGLLAVGAVRAAEWLFVLCFLAAVVAASLAVVSRRSIYGFVYDVCAVPMQAIGSIPWVYRGMRAVRGRTGSSTQRVWWSLAATTVLLLIFVPLLAGADAVFARWVEDLLPSLAVDELVRWVFVFLVVALCAAGALYLLAGPPPAAADAPEGAYSTFFGVNNIRGQQTRRRFSRLEWGLPMGALTLLFALFLASRLAAMFGGDAYVMSNGGLTYAEYARTGFWQLSIVSMLTLAVIAIVQRTAAQESTADRLWLRLAVGAVSVLTLVIVASALHRMWVYQEAYGFTILRLLVEVLELWIGLVYLMVLASLVKLRRDWVPRAAIGAAAATLLTLAAINPELLIAERNVDRAAHGKRIDLYYLSDLSPDILPALDRLPDADRDRVEKAIRDRLHDDTWQGWNLSRSAARN